MPTMTEFRERLDGINIHELGPEKCLKELCELGLIFSPNSPNEIGMAYDFKESLCGRVAEVLGLSTDTEFGPEDFHHFIDSVESGLSAEAIGENFSMVLTKSTPS